MYLKDDCLHKVSMMNVCVHGQDWIFLIFTHALIGLETQCCL